MLAEISRWIGHLWQHGLPRPGKANKSPCTIISTLFQPCYQPTTTSITNINHPWLMINNYHYQPTPTSASSPIDQPSCNRPCLKLPRHFSTRSEESRSCHHQSSSRCTCVRDMRWASCSQMLDHDLRPLAAPYEEPWLVTTRWPNLQNMPLQN